jgi:AcrR family transcriptional regulator
MTQNVAPGERPRTRSNGHHGHNGTAEKRSPGRPRSEESRQAILRSTLKLLKKEGGFPDLSIEAIAADANVGKTTVYRWWPNKAVLVADAFAASADTELRFPDTGSVENDMSLQMRRLIRVFRSERGKVVAALLAGGQSDPELLEAFRERFLWPRRRQAYQTLQRGIERGELPPDSNLDLILDCLYGPIYMRFLIRHDKLDEAFTDQICNVVLKGLKVRHQTAT